jgi:hypothetical protein
LSFLPMNSILWNLYLDMLEYAGIYRNVNLN